MLTGLTGGDIPQATPTEIRMETIPARLPDDIAVAFLATQARNPKFIPSLRGLKYQSIKTSGK